MSVSLELNPKPSEFMPDDVVFRHKEMHGAFLFARERRVIKLKTKQKLKEYYRLLRTLWTFRLSIPERFFSLEFKSPENAVKMIERQLDVSYEMSCRNQVSADKMKGWACDRLEHETEIDL